MTFILYVGLPIIGLVAIEYASHYLNQRKEQRKRDRATYERIRISTKPCYENYKAHRLAGESMQYAQSLATQDLRCQPLTVEQFSTASVFLYSWCMTWEADNQWRYNSTVGHDTLVKPTTGATQRLPRLPS